MNRFETQMLTFSIRYPQGKQTLISRTKQQMHKLKINPFSWSVSLSSTAIRVAEYFASPPWNLSAKFPFWTSSTSMALSFIYLPAVLNDWAADAAKCQEV